VHPRDGGIEVIADEDAPPVATEGDPSSVAGDRTEFRNPSPSPGDEEGPASPNLLQETGEARLRLVGSDLLPFHHN